MTTDNGTFSATPPRANHAPAGRTLPKPHRALAVRFGIRVFRILALLLIVLALLLVFAWWQIVAMPGSSHHGPLPPLTIDEGIAAYRLRACVMKLAGEFPDRNVAFARGAMLQQAAEYVEAEFRAAGLPVETQEFDVRGVKCRNLQAEVSGSAVNGRLIVVGAHYDAVYGSPGANDNASGVAALLELARRFASHSRPVSLRFVAFVNEEPPHFQTPQMGSLVYARRCRERNENVVAMLSLETLGYYSELPDSQHYPPLFDWFYPSRGDFIAFAGNIRSRGLVRRCVKLFRSHTQFPSEGAALPEAIPETGWSDHWSFWQQGYPSLMITDTAPFRYPHYHEAEDTPEKLDYERMARVIAGLEHVMAGLAAGE